MDAKEKKLYVKNTNKNTNINTLKYTYICECGKTILSTRWKNINAHKNTRKCEKILMEKYQIKDNFHYHKKDFGL
tara:strand:- start:727 stop:951 length:225 start_codon:yes stop_codon:yes gene_type:complete